MNLNYLINVFLVVNIDNWRNIICHKSKIGRINKFIATEELINKIPII